MFKRWFRGNNIAGGNEEADNKIKQLQQERDKYKAERDRLLEASQTWVPNGHFYSPIPSIDELKAREAELFSFSGAQIEGVDLNVDRQLALLQEFKQYYSELPFAHHKKENQRYYFQNDFFCHADAIVFYSMLRHLKPKRVIEVGSGFSSAVLLDTNELFFRNEIICTFIEPYPERLLSLVKEKDSIHLVQKKLEELNTDFFDELGENDILFIDSSHVSKIGSDVNHLFFDIIPRIKKGVYIHIHDIFFPFEYPKSWVYEGRAWNEAYMLRAFLQYNDSFEIIFWNHFLGQFYSPLIESNMPLYMKNTGGSIWIRRVK